MKYFASNLLIGACMAVLPLAAQAQARKPVAKPVAKPAARPTVLKPTAKPVAKPAAPTAPAATTQAAPAPVAAPAQPTAPAAANTGPFGVGTNVLNVGIGLGNRYGYGTGFFGGSSSVSPAISVSFERGIVPLGPGVLGVGVFAGYQGARYDLGGGDEWKYTDIIVTLRGAFHYPVLPQLDAYGGLGLGLRHAGVSFEGSGLGGVGGASANELAAGVFVGGRYFFNERLGAFAELGYDQTYLKAGLAAKF